MEKEIKERLLAHKKFCIERIEICNEVLADLGREFANLPLLQKDTRGVAYYLTKIASWSEELKIKQDRLGLIDNLLSFIEDLEKAEEVE